MKRKIAYGNFVFGILFCLVIMLGCGGGGSGVSTSQNDMTATAQELQNKSFTLASGEVFNSNLKNESTTLTFGTFTGNSGSFALVSQKGTAMGKVTLGSCTFVITLSTFPMNQGPQTGDTVVARPCNMSDDNLELLMTNTETGLTVEAISQLLSDPVDLTGITVKLTGDPNFAAFASHTSGEKIIAVTESDAQNNVSMVKGGIWISPKGKNIAMFFYDNGLPKRMVLNNEVVVLYLNYTSSTVDIAVILPNGAYQIHRNTHIDSLLMVKALLQSQETASVPKLTTRTTLQKPILETAADITRGVAIGTKFGACALSVVSTFYTANPIVGELSIEICSSAIISALGELYADNPIIGTSDAIVTATTCFDLQPINIIDCILSLLSRGTNILNGAATIRNGETSATQALQRQIIITIASPTNGATYKKGDLVPFYGYAKYQNGDYIFGTYTWNSSIDNKIGEGGLLTSVNTLSEGTHTITLFASDLENKGGSAKISITIKPSAPNVTGTPWIGKWLLVNFLSTDDNGIWSEDDLSGIGMTAEVTSTTWKETDDSGCAITFSYTVDSNLRYARHATSKSSQCPAIPLNIYDDSGKLEFPTNSDMIDHFDLLPGDDLAAFKWKRQ